MNPKAFADSSLLLGYLKQNQAMAVELIDEEDSDSLLNKKFDWTISTYTESEM